MNYNKIRVAAMAYYANLSDEERLEAQKFYKSLDTDGNGTISHNEYFSFLKKEGYRDTQNLFKMLDKNGDGVLDFEECITLFFMIRVHHNHVSCDGCGASMWDIYFVCAECYEAGGNTYDLCCDCYPKKNFKHLHAVFFDNFKLLRDM
ncbi:hypothetical protein RHGRI_003680 [Rhododendron griersonianum]|uniref:EF-hand domain-containing protein n=1 Tax=Rhododendron griersonianum TaxID=479676 RepID=A0AAV6L7P5_9ERIC|nr:hypothetical protein RHGRI_003680 [Rhododendron griersonianum]